MRLDHLLSKEHLAPAVPASRATSWTFVPGWLLKGGTSTTWPSPPFQSVHPACREGTLERGGRPGTLLGPEGTGASPPHGTGRAGVDRPGDEPLAIRQAGVGPQAGTARTLRTAQWTRASLKLCGQVVKGTRWMPWHQEPMKDVGACDKPRVAGNRALIRGFPNGETRLETCPVTHA